MLLAYGFAYRDTEPLRALGALRRGLTVARDSGNRNNESQTASVLCRVESAHGETVAALEYFRLAIQCRHESGNFMISTPLAALATLFDRLERYEPSAILAGYAFGPITAASYPELSTTMAHLREVLGEQTYETLAHRGHLVVEEKRIAATSPPLTPSTPIAYPQAAVRALASFRVG